MPEWLTLKTEVLFNLGTTNQQTRKAMISQISLRSLEVQGLDRDLLSQIKENKVIEAQVTKQITIKAPG